VFKNGSWGGSGEAGGSASNRVSQRTGLIRFFGFGQSSGSGFAECFNVKSSGLIVLVKYSIYLDY
jgi:hypothetical protein